MTAPFAPARRLEAERDEEADLDHALAGLRSEAARLRESEAMYRHAAEFGRILAWRADPGGRVTAISPALARAVGAEDDSWTQETLWSLVHPDDHDLVRARWDLAMASGEPFEAAFRARRADGELRFLVTRAVAQRDGSGRIESWFGSGEDREDLREAARLRDEAETRYRLALCATGDAAWDHDLPSDTIAWNESSADLFGSRGGTSGSWWRERIHPEDRDRVVASLAATIESGGTDWVSAYRFRRDDGHYADMLDRGFILRSPDGEPKRAIGAMIDMSGATKAAAEIRAHQSELGSAGRVGGVAALAATLAQELNQALSVVHNYLAGARRLAAGRRSFPADIADALDAASAGAERAATIVRQLRSRFGRVALAPTAQRLDRLFVEALATPALQGVAVETRIDEGAERVRADPDLVAELLAHLLSLALARTAAEPRRRLSLSACRAGANVQVGLLYGPAQAPGSPDEGALGLSVCHTIAALHGGRLWIEAPEGDRFRVQFTLPAAEARPGEEEGET